jgi:putative addiction module killer protein
MTIEITDVYDEWMESLSDAKAKAQIHRRVKRLTQGNPGNVGPVGQGISEMRIVAHGPGYRIYYKYTGDGIITLLCGGNKSTQQADIARAKELAQNTEIGALKWKR